MAPRPSTTVVIMAMSLRPWSRIALEERPDMGVELEQAVARINPSINQGGNEMMLAAHTVRWHLKSI
jgi:hypothetical protein